MERHTRGFVALISVIIISTILLTLVFTLETSSFFSRFDVLDAENKRVSLGLAEACVHVAMLRLAQSSGYSGTELVTVESSDPQKICKICSFTPGTNPIVQTKAVFNGAYSNVSIAMTVSGGAIAITGWSEVPNNAACVIP